MENNNELLFSVFNGDLNLTDEAYQEVLNFAAFVKSQKASAQSEDCK